MFSFTSIFKPGWPCHGRAIWFIFYLTFCFTSLWKFWYPAYIFPLRSSPVTRHHDSFSIIYHSKSGSFILENFTLTAYESLPVSRFEITIIPRRRVPLSENQQPSTVSNSSISFGRQPHSSITTMPVSLHSRFHRCAGTWDYLLVAIFTAQRIAFISDFSSTSSGPMAHRHIALHLLSISMLE